ncbi:MAG: class I SAM-dependent methyltransferase [Terriglobales bacterium]
MSVLPICTLPGPTAAPPVARVARARPRWRDRHSAPLRDFPIRDEVLLQFLPLRRDAAVLELGPGCGYTAYWLAPQVRCLALVDIAAAAIAELRQVLHDRGPIEYAVWDISQPGLPASIRGGFDAAFALDVLEYVTDPAVALRNVCGLLRPGGELLLSFPNFPPGEGDGAIRFATTGELAGLLRQAGFARWRISTIRPRFGPRVLYAAAHEWPLSLLRQLRGSGGQPRAYDDTWAFQVRRHMARLRPALHLYWIVLDRLLAPLAPVFAVKRESSAAAILRRQVLVEAWK